MSLRSCKGVIGLCAACAGVASVTVLPQPVSAQAAVDFDPSPAQVTRLQRVQVQRVDLASQKMVAVDRSTGLPVVIQLEPATLINGKRDQRFFRNIGKGDLVDVKLTPLQRGGYAVRELTVNFWVGDALILGKANGAYTFQELDYKSAAPLTVKMPHNGYLLPTIAQPQAGAEVETFEKRIATDALPIGAHVKLFGYKRPNSNTVVFFRAERYR